MSQTDIRAPKALTFSLLRLLADGEFHSGELLARKLGVSRASVNNALKGIEEFGVTLFSVRGRGYRLVTQIEWLDAVKIRAVLRTPAQFGIVILDAAASSNSLLLKQAAQQASSGSVLAVEWQSAGRGRLGRTWHTSLGGAITFSLLWRFKSGLAALSGLSLAVGVAVMRALNGAGITGISLKWPNDILSEQGKVAGILIEAQGDMLGPSAAVIGVGLNLRLPGEIEQRIDQRVADLSRLVTDMPERNRLFGLILQELADVLQLFSEGGFAPLREEWERYHIYQGRRVVMHSPDGSSIQGKVLGVTEDGALRVETEQGAQVFNAGEISLRGT